MPWNFRVLVVACSWLANWGLSRKGRRKKGVLCVHATGGKIRNGSLLSAGNSEGEELFNFLPLKNKEEGACRALGRKCGKRGQVAKKISSPFFVSLALSLRISGGIWEKGFEFLSASNVFPFPVWYPERKNQFAPLSAYFPFFHFYFYLPCRSPDLFSRIFPFL